MKDVTFIEDGNPDYNSGNIININKMTLLGTQLNQLKLHQQSEYEKNLENKSEDLIQHLSRLNYLTEDKLENLSIKMEPLAYVDEDTTDETYDFILDGVNRNLK